MLIALLNTEITKGIKIRDMTLGYKYYLGSGNHYFVYRSDIHSTRTIRADLFNSKGDKINTTLVKGGMLDLNRRHEDVINEFEILTQQVKPLK